MKVKIEEYHWDTFLGIWKKPFESNWIEIDKDLLENFWDQFESTSERRFELVKQENYQEVLDRVYEWRDTSSFGSSWDSD